MDTQEAVETVQQKLKEQGIGEEKDAVQEEKAEAKVETQKEEVLEQEYSEVEKEALATGWKPEGEKTAGEWVRTASLYDEVSKRGKQIKSLQSQMDELAHHIKSMEKAGYQSQLEELESQKREAVVRSDIDSVDYYDEQIREIEQKVQEDPPKLDPYAQQFVDKHQDLLKDPSYEAQEIREFISMRDQELASFGLSPEEHIKTLEKDLSVKYPQRYGEPEQSQTVRAVESDVAPVPSNRRQKFTFKDLNSDQKKIYKYMESRDVMTGEEYIKQLVELGELK